MLHIILGYHHQDREKDMLLGTSVAFLDALVMKLQGCFQMEFSKDLFDCLGVIFGFFGSHI